MKSAVHTGKNTQFGGAMYGFIKVAYQVEISGVVKKEPRAPAIRQMAILIINFMISKVFVVVIEYLQLYLLSTTRFGLPLIR
jgi:hypothetical protein